MKTALIILCSSLFSLAGFSQWVARHNMTGAQYQDAFTDYVKQGFRLSTVSGYTCGGQERYIALWEKKSGPEWAARHGMSGADYQAAFDDFGKKGFRLTHVSGYGVNNQAKFAAIWDKSNGPAWAARHNLNAAQYQQAFDDFAKQGYRLVHVSGYVVNNVEYFAGIWEKSSANYIARHNLNSAQYQQAFNDAMKQGYVLKTVSGYTKNGVNLYAAIWEKEASPMWAARHGVSNGNYQYVFDNMYYQGYKPVYVNAYASGNGCEYNAIWTNTNMKGSDIGAIDEAVNQYMSSQSVKGLSLAICKDGRLVFAKGYGLADVSAGEEMSPDQPMRIMSISKPVTSVGIMTLLDQKKLTSLDRAVFGPGSILGSKYAIPAGKEKLNRITVRQLLNMTSGLRTCNGEGVFWDQNKNADDAMNVLLASGDLITTDTGAKYIYSNTNFFILARVIEQLSGQSYETFIRANVLNKCGIGNTMYVGNANGEARAGEGTYTPMNKMNLQLWAGFGGWVARPIDLLKFLNKVDGAPIPSDILTAATHTEMTKGSTVSPGYGCGWSVSGSKQNHNGCFNGTRSFLVDLGNGLSYSVIINNNPTSDDCGWTMKSAIEAGLNKVSGYPAYDLF